MEACHFLLEVIYTFKLSIRTSEIQYWDKLCKHIIYKHILLMNAVFCFVYFSGLIHVI